VTPEQIQTLRDTIAKGRKAEADDLAGKRVDKDEWYMPVDVGHAWEALWEHADAILAALTAASPPAPEPAKVRCWRAVDEYMHIWSCDRLRLVGGVVHHVYGNGSTIPSEWTVEDCETQVRIGLWVECPDEPYRPEGEGK